MLNYEAALEVLEDKNLNGWRKLVTRFYDHLPEAVDVVSVYQKWGGLRFDIRPDDYETERLIEDIEQESRTICEICGELASEVRKNGETRTLCEFHAGF
jgi:hypothetical protein